LLSDEEPETDETLKVLNFPTLMASGSNQLEPVNQTGIHWRLCYILLELWQTKGVMLSHGNLLHQITTFGAVFGAVQPARRSLPQCPPSWHAYERTCEYFFLSQVVRKFTPTSASQAGLEGFKPQIMVGVPRLWESIYEGVQSSSASNRLTSKAD